MHLGPIDYYKSPSKLRSSRNPCCQFVRTGKKMNEAQIERKPKERLHTLNNSLLLQPEFFKYFYSFRKFPFLKEACKLHLGG